MSEVHLFVKTDKSSKVALKFTPDEQMVVRGLDLAKGVMAYWKIKMADGNTNTNTKFIDIPQKGFSMTIYKNGKKTS